MFLEDFSIEVSELVLHWRAEGLIDEQQNYVDLVNRGIDLIENLKESFLLEDGSKKGTVKMHDVLRDGFCLGEISIGSFQILSKDFQLDFQHDWVSHTRT